MGMIVETTCSKCDFNVETMDNSVFESSGYHHNLLLFKLSGQS